MKRLLPAILASGLLVVPSGASGQLLASLCLRNTDGLCFNATTFSSTGTASGYSNHLQGYWSGYNPVTSNYTSYLYPDWTEYGWRIGVGGSSVSSGHEDPQTDPGALWEATWTSAESGALLGYDRAVPNLTSFAFGNLQGPEVPAPYRYWDWTFCDQGAPAQYGTCELHVSVPEPGTYLLMLTGVLGLGLVAYRRREDALA